jgi:hypothetical protein
MSITWNLITAWMTIIIAVTAVIVAMKQAQDAREHNKLSVTPHLDFFQNLGGQKLGIEIKNNGVGPAIIKDIRIFTPHGEFDGTSHAGQMGALKQLGLVLSDVGYSGLQEGDFLAAGDSLWLFYRSGQQKLPQPEIYYVERFKKISVRISYESVYGDSYIMEQGPLFGTGYDRDLST